MPGVVIARTVRLGTDLEDLGAASPVDLDARFGRLETQILELGFVADIEAALSGERAHLGQKGLTLSGALEHRVLCCPLRLRLADVSGVISIRGHLSLGPSGVLHPKIRTAIIVSAGDCGLRLIAGPAY